MEKLKNTIDQYGRWNGLSVYIDRIEAHIDIDFSLALENAKSLLETIGKEICLQKNIEIPITTNTSSILKKAFHAIGYSSSTLVFQISKALATIGQNFGELRNEIGTTSHGKPLTSIKDRNNKIDELTKEFLIDTTVIVACFLIRTFEDENPRQFRGPETEQYLDYNNNEEFNDFLDDTFGEFSMGKSSFLASEILFNLDKQAYLTEYHSYKADFNE